jgi:hypothetical protein
MPKKTLRAKCLEAAQLLARISEADDNGWCTCWSCKERFHYKSGDGGHFIPKGQSSYWALRPENIHFQCKGCNGFGMKFGVAESQYTISMIKEYGEAFVRNMHETRRTPIKMYKKDYEEFLKITNEKIRAHKRRLGEL